MKTKQLILTMILGLGTITLFAQELTNAVIKYEQKINVHANLKGAQKAMKAFIPEFISSDLELHYMNGMARIKEIKTEQKQGITISSSSQDMLLDGNTKTSKNFTELGDSRFYTESSFDTEENIILLKEIKQIGTYTCLSAEMSMGKNDKMTIWYCPELPKNFSPMGFLPVDGMVLEIESEKISYIYKSIEKNSANPALLLMPTGYKKVSEEQLMDLTEEYTEEMM
ncbi:MAG: GLPGLI family protein [Bacteroidales bacterium]|nr:GLPGLI family protein [Bacteroidales bacterium]